MLTNFAIFTGYGRVKVISEKIQNILNEQINKEFYSAYLYLAMSAYFDEIGLKGFSNWTRVQAREEVDHGMILFDYIIERQGKVNLRQIDMPETSFSDTLEVFEKIYSHEKYVTDSINCVANMTDEECDLATRYFINWYIKEQVEEEANVDDVIKKIKLFGGEKAALYHLDKELASREYKYHSYES